MVKAPELLLGALASHRFYRWGAFITGSKKRSFSVFIIRCLATVSARIEAGRIALNDSKEPPNQNGKISATVLKMVYMIQKKRNG